LWADSTIEHSVSTILAHNSITEVSLIHVKSEAGVVTLSGKVDSQEIVEVAESLSSMQPGVKHVDNNLRVEHDELTPFLLNRLGWI
jgi:osmotically-inducible protein OsmY